MTAYPNTLSVAITRADYDALRAIIAALVANPYTMYVDGALTCWRCGNTEAEGHTARCAVGAGERALKGAM